MIPGEPLRRKPAAIKLSDQALKSGKNGWLAVSPHIDWRWGWSLKVHCPLTEPRSTYRLPRPPDGVCEFVFDPSYCGKLVISDRYVNFTFRIPDCLDPPGKKSFDWGQPILIGDRMFHCALRLELRGPKDGSYLRRRAATPERNGAVEFVTPSASGDVVMATVQDSDAGRGRHERLHAFLDEHRTRYRLESSDGRTGVNNEAFWRTMTDAKEFVDSNSINLHRY